MASAVLPSTLISAVQEQRAILFLGAGASVGAIHPKNKAVPMGDKLRDMISDEFLGGELKFRTLSAVAAMAATEIGLTAFQKYIRDLFFEYQPAEHHLLIPTFRWRAIVTTNLDLIIERAYEKSRGSIQTLVKSWKDADLFDNRMQEASDPVGYYKLHGCIDYYTDQSIPMILGMEEYASYATNRTRFYGRLDDLARDNPIIFCGYSISDPHIQQFLFDLTDKTVNRPMYFNVGPDIGDIETRYWAAHQIVCIPLTLAQFLQELDKKIAPLARRLPRNVSANARLSLETHYRSATAEESELLRFYIENDAIHLHSALVPKRQDAVEFYKGYDTGFGCILQNLDITRAITDSLLVDAILLDDSERKNGELFLIKGPAGNGKTVTLKRVAWEAATSYEKVALYVETAAGLRFDALSEIHGLIGKRIFLFVDRVALLRDELESLLRTCRARKFPLTVVGAERENEWHIYCETLVQYTAQEFAIAYLSKEEIVQLVGALERHHALGLLAELKPAERIEAFVTRAERQLLVALHETTLGIPFEKAVLDEFERVMPNDARQLYLKICALHQFGAPVRAGLVSRVSGIRFERFAKEFLKPLMDVVLVEEDRHTGGDVYYRTRHRHVAELVFNQVMPTDEDRLNLLDEMMQGMNIDYSSDRESFSRMVRGRGMVEMFSNVRLGRLLYDRAEEIGKNEWFVAHQRAVFELNHPNGILAEAEKAAARAAQLNANSRSVRHTQAEIARRQASMASDPVLKKTYRRSARASLSGDFGRLSEYDLHTRAKLALDELREIIDQNRKNPGSSAGFLAAVKDAELAIERGREEFPESAEILSAEADLRDLLNQTPQALASLEKAFSLNPQQDWLAIRLAKRYADAGDLARGMEVIQKCLKDNPDSKSAHLQMARFLMDANKAQSLVIDHLRKSFTAGDNNFEGQFWYARELFLSNRTREAKNIFESVTERARGKFRSDATAVVTRSDGKSRTFDGVMGRKEEGYAFVKLFEFAEEIFCSRGESARSDWDRIHSHSPISCFLAFNRRGPRATRLTLRQI